MCSKDCKLHVNRAQTPEGSKPCRSIFGTHKRWLAGRCGCAGRRCAPHRFLALLAGPSPFDCMMPATLTPCELRKITLPRTRVNTVASETPRAEDKRVIQHTVRCGTDTP